MNIVHGSHNCCPQCQRFLIQKEVFPERTTTWTGFYLWCFCNQIHREVVAASHHPFWTAWNYKKMYALQNMYGSNSQLQKHERTGTSFLYWSDWKSNHFNWNVTEWKATQPILRVFIAKLCKWEPRKSCKIPFKSVQFCGLSTQSIHCFAWYLKSYHSAVFLL